LRIFPSIRRNALRPCSAPSAGPTGRPTSITWRWVRRARGAEVPASFWTDPLIYRGGSDTFVGPCDPIRIADLDWGVDFEAEVAVIVGDVPMGAPRDAARDAIRLLMLVNDVSLRNLIPAELAKGFGFLQGKAQTAFSPVVVTPDELGHAWDGAKVSLPLLSHVNGAPFRTAQCGRGHDVRFPGTDRSCGEDAAARVRHHRRLRHGIEPRRRWRAGPADRRGPGVGYSCIAEIRSVETIRHGAPKTPFLAYGDRVRIEMPDAEGRSIFGAIDQEVIRYDPPAR